MSKHIHLQYRNQFFRVVTKSKRRQNHPNEHTHTYTRTFKLYCHCSHWQDLRQLFWNWFRHGPHHNPHWLYN